MTQTDQVPLKLIFVRHGQTRYNVLDRVNADPTVENDLTEQGGRQAAHCAAILASERLDIVYSSEFPRAKQTAKAIVAGHPLSLKIDRRINETGAFAFDGRPCSEWHAALVPDRFTAEPPGCEAFSLFRGRLAAFLDDIRTRPERNVLVVSHEEPIQIMLGILENLSDRDARARPIDHCTPYRWSGTDFKKRDVSNGKN